MPRVTVPLVPYDENFRAGKVANYPILLRQ